MCASRFLLPVCLCVAFLANSLNSSLARAQFPGPVEPAIDLAMAVRTPRGLCLQRSIQKQIPETRQETYTVPVQVAVNVMDPVTMKISTVMQQRVETRVRVVTVMKPVVEHAIEEHPWDHCTFTSRDGAKISSEEAQRLLGGPLLVVRLIQGESLPAEYRPLFKPDLLCLTIAAAVVPRPPSGPVDVEGFQLPTGAPKFRLLSIDANGQYVFRSVANKTENRTFFQTKTEKRIEDGKEASVHVRVPVTAVLSYEASQKVAFPADAVAGQAVDGTPLTDRHREALRQREIPVLMNDAPEPLDKEWLALFQPQMLLLSVPAAEPGASRPVAVPSPVPITTPPASQD
jgi:hypothetical protein